MVEKSDYEGNNPYYLHHKIGEQDGRISALERGMSEVKDSLRLIFNKLDLIREDISSQKGQSGANEKSSDKFMQFCYFVATGVISAVTTWAAIKYGH